MQWLNRLEKSSDEAIEIDYGLDQVKSFIDRLPFELTEAQKSSVNEIFRDLKAPIRMHLLLQGDVGSGKNSSCCNLYVCVKNGWLSISIDGTN
ncbi:hypothetical protein ACVPOQ_15525 [Staphylococcus aureus]